MSHPQENLLFTEILWVLVLEICCIWSSQNVLWHKDNNNTNFLLGLEPGFNQSASHWCVLPAAPLCIPGAVWWLLGLPPSVCLWRCFDQMTWWDFSSVSKLLSYCGEEEVKYFRVLKNGLALIHGTAKQLWLLMYCKCKHQRGDFPPLWKECVRILPRVLTGLNRQHWAVCCASPLSWLWGSAWRSARAVSLCLVSVSLGWRVELYCSRYGTLMSPRVSANVEFQTFKLKYRVTELLMLRKLNVCFITTTLHPRWALWNGL